MGGEREVDGVDAESAAGGTRRAEEADGGVKFQKEMDEGVPEEGGGGEGEQAAESEVVSENNRLAP